MAINYRYLGHYDLSIFMPLYHKTFAKNRHYPQYNPNAHINTVVGMISSDPNINDVRWAAYILATVAHETALPNEKKRWLWTMDPIDEIGHGKGQSGYYEPVKVRIIDNGLVQVTEKDGDQFEISPTTGGITKRTSNKPGHRPTPGAPDGAPATPTYNTDPGTEHTYFGRGYVQLTWWYNYASSSIAINRGLALLHDPELVKQPEIAYALMTHGMLTGEGFANKHKFSEFFSGKDRKYEQARLMVNSKDTKTFTPIANLAREFEKILLASRRWVPPPIWDGLAGAPSRWPPDAKERRNAGW